MIIKGENIGKKFGKTWIFKNRNFKIGLNDKVAITGKNGTGKSTMLQIIAGYLTPTKGSIYLDKMPIDIVNIESVIIGPYTELIEEFTLKEFLTFHQNFKKPICSIEKMATSASLPLSQPIGEFSTGMKQRTKLITAFFFKNDLIFMDEPTSNLDEEGFFWWKNCLKKIDQSSIIIASNEVDEINLCEEAISL